MISNNTNKTVPRSLFIKINRNFNNNNCFVKIVTEQNNIINWYQVNEDVLISIVTIQIYYFPNTSLIHFASTEISLLNPFSCSDYIHSQNVLT